MRTGMRCDFAERDEQIVDYLYGELDLARRQTFETHLDACAACRAELDGLEATRERIAEWAPPEPAEAGLGLRVMRDRQPPAPRPARGSLAGWGLAAAAALVLAASAALANLEVRISSDGLVVRTGWAQAGVTPATSDPGLTPAAAAGSAAFEAELTRVQTRLAELEATLDRQSPGAVAVAVNPGGLSDEQLIQRVRQMIAQSQGDTLRRVSDVFVEFDRQRRNDLALIQQGLGQYQGATSAELAQLRNHLVRVAFPEQQER